MTINGPVYAVDGGAGGKQQGAIAGGGGGGFGGGGGGGESEGGVAGSGGGGLFGGGGGNVDTGGGGGGTTGGSSGGPGASDGSPGSGGTGEGDAGNALIGQGGGVFSNPGSNASGGSTVTLNGKSMVLSGSGPVGGGVGGGPGPGVNGGTVNIQDAGDLVLANLVRAAGTITVTSNSVSDPTGATVLNAGTINVTTVQNIGSIAQPLELATSGGLMANAGGSATMVDQAALGVTVLSGSGAKGGYSLSMGIPGATFITVAAPQMTGPVTLSTIALGTITLPGNSFTVLGANGKDGGSLTLNTETVNWGSSSTTPYTINAAAVAAAAGGVGGTIVPKHQQFKQRRL